ncbi:MAG: hypothetical protein HQ581_27690 [Planctomycetes bacterium]|nr:hypothetical protein [Planctomycetota bacterium]
MQELTDRPLDLQTEIDPVVQRALDRIAQQAEQDRAFVQQLAMVLSALETGTAAKTAGRWRRYVMPSAGLAAVGVGCWWISPSLCLIVLGGVFVLDPLIAGLVRAGGNHTRNRKRKG